LAQKFSYSSATEVVSAQFFRFVLAQFFWRAATAHRFCRKPKAVTSYRTPKWGLHLCHFSFLQLISALAQFFVAPYPYRYCNALSV